MKILYKTKIKISGTFVEGVKNAEILPDDVQRVLKIVEENNIGLMNLILHLMLRANMNQGVATLNRRDLELLDKYLLKPEHVFPALNDYIL